MDRWFSADDGEIWFRWNGSRTVNVFVPDRWGSGFANVDVWEYMEVPEVGEVKDDIADYLNDETGTDYDGADIGEGDPAYGLDSREGYDFVRYGG